MVTLTLQSEGRLSAAMEEFELHWPGEGMRLPASSQCCFSSCPSTPAHTVLPHCAELTPTSFRPCAGMHADQVEEVFSVLADKTQKLAAMHAACRRLKRERLWEIIFLHPDNIIVHSSRSMFC